MFGNGKTFASFSVPDLAKAKDFYVNKLGLEVVMEMEGVMQLKTSDCRLMIYIKPNHVPAAFTVFNFEVDDVNAAVDELNKMGITMEMYPEMGTNDRGITKDNMAWFKDPFGNILSAMQLGK
ncbi:MAG: VOC family protein [Candidatus Dojkabacteria bacterium]